MQGQRANEKGQGDEWDGMHDVKSIKSIIKDRLNKQSTVGGQHEVFSDLKISSGCEIPQKLHSL